MVSVEIVYIGKEKSSFIEVLNVDKGLSAKTVIEKSNLLKSHPELNLDSLAIGVYSKKITLDTTIEKDCRIEIYRELTLTPMERRRLLAKKRQQKR